MTGEGAAAGGMGPTVRVLRAVVGLVDGGAEALVAAAAADHVRPGPVERELVLAHLGHGRLQALQGAGLLQSQRGPEVFAGGFWKRKANRHLFPTEQGGDLARSAVPNISLFGHLPKGVLSGRPLGTNPSFASCGDCEQAAGLLCASVSFCIKLWKDLR